VTSFFPPGYIHHWVSDPAHAALRGHTHHLAAPSVYALSRGRMILSLCFTEEE